MRFAHAQGARAREPAQRALRVRFRLARNTRQAQLGHHDAAIGDEYDFARPHLPEQRAEASLELPHAHRFHGKQCSHMRLHWQPCRVRAATRRASGSLRVIRQQAVKLGHRIDDLLEFSRMGRKSLALRRIEMTTLVEQIYQELSSGAASGRVVVIEPLPAALGDPALIGRVWANLLSNAITFTGKTDEPKITVSGKVEGAEAVHWVTDNGAGFSRFRLQRTPPPAPPCSAHGSVVGCVERRVYRKDVLLSHVRQQFRLADAPPVGAGLCTPDRPAAGRWWAYGVRDRPRAESSTLEALDFST